MDNKQLIRQPFGLNIALPNKTITEVKQAAQKEIENNTIKPVVNFFTETYGLSQEEITTDLRKAQSQIYALGQAMREGQYSHSLNMTF